MHTVSKGFLILATIAVCLTICGCDEVTPAPAATPTPAPAANGLSLEQVMADFEVFDVPATAGDVAASRAALDFAADALEMGDKDLFLDTLSLDMRQDFLSAGFSTADTAGLAEALRSATLSQPSGQYVIGYDTTAGSMAYRIMLVKEDGIWKIGAL